MCCGKDMPNKKRRRKQSAEWSQNHGAFCGHACYVKHKRWQNARKARCGCGMATNQPQSTCAKCLANKQKQAGWLEVARWASHKIGQCGDEWEHRAKSATYSLRLRERDTIHEKATRGLKEPRTWTEAAMILMERARIRQARPLRTEWLKRADTAARNLRRRNPLNLSNWRNNRGFDAHCPGLN